MKSRSSNRFGGILNLGALAVVVGLGSLVGASAAAGKPVGASASPDPVPVDAFVVGMALEESFVESPAEQAREQYIQSQMEMWADLFGKQVGENPPRLTLDFRTDQPGLIPGVSDEGDAFSLIALEVTPVPVDEGSLAAVVSAEDIQSFKEAQGEASLIFGAIQTDRGVRFILAASSSVRTESGGTDTVLSLLAVAERGTPTCPVLQANDFVTPESPEGDERGFLAYCRCAARIARCQVFASACVLIIGVGFPACVVSCAAPPWLHCVACIAAASAGTIVACERTVECINNLRNNQCIQ